MDSGLPRKRSLHPKSSKRSDLVEKIFLPFATIIATSIFYLTGWVYISHWYSYYGIDATQLNIPIQLVLLHGFPGVLFLIASGLVAFFVFRFDKEVFHLSFATTADIPNIVIYSYVVAWTAMLIIFLNVGSFIQIPIEFWISSIGLPFVLIIYGFKMLGDVLNFTAKLFLPKRIIEGALYPFKVKVFGNVIIRFAETRGLKATIKVFRTLHSQEWNDLLRMLNDEAVKNKAQLRYSTNQVLDIVKNSWQFWIIAIIVFYFLISVSSSALLGEWDAARGGRLMIGDWHVPAVSLFSTSRIPALKAFETPTAAGYEYKPLGLIASDDKVYYLADWKPEYFYSKRPNVYIIHRLDSLTLNFIVTPNIQQTLLLPALPGTPIITPPAAIPTP